jgi:beta-lactamase superfamily II metal-dependent hydrolase
LAGRLPFWRRTLDLALLTDPRAGDARGLEDAASHFHIVHAVDAGMLNPTTEYLAWRDAVAHAGAAYTQVRQGNTLALDATTTLRVLAPPQQLYPPREGSTTASNDTILQLETPGLRVLFLGSADAYALDALTGSGEDLRFDVVELALVPGAQVDLTGPLGTILHMAHPRLIIVSDAPLPPNCAAAPKATAVSWDIDADVAAATGALVYRTSQAGTIELRGDAGGWSLG